ncbi:hypothetical protein [Pseudarthrobacter sp. NS4]|uniref:hypothetical protein n=1 Tax=Pseudarthrobacter sp. NS4 TaxID=2973976 RepID=UPI0021625EB3|nr:hypothetical protein [Pseudarthrobacter sp. NS4]
MTRHADSLRDMVDDMLLDAGYAGDAGDAELRGALLSLGSLAALQVPPPSGQLARMLAGAGEEPPAAPFELPDGWQGHGKSDAGDELASRRQLRRHRPMVLGLALIAGMGTGIGGVAASSPAPGHAGSSSVQQLLEDWSPSWSLPAQAAAGGFLQTDTAKGAEDAMSGQPATEPRPTGPGPADIHQLRQDQPAGQQQVVAPPPSPAPPEAADTPPGSVHDGGQAPGQDQGRAAAEAAVADGGEAGQPPRHGRVIGGEGQPADGAGPAVEAAGKPVKEVVRQAGDAIGAAGKPSPGNSWLEKFKR